MQADHFRTSLPTVPRRAVPGEMAGRRLVAARASRAENTRTVPWTEARASAGAPPRPPRRARATAVALCAVLTAVACSPIEWLAARYPRVLFSVDTDRPVLALTIDDGPDPVTTPAILDLLRDHDARATFFVLGERVPGQEPLLRRIVSEGHELGNHLLSDQPSIDLTDEQFERELRATHRALTKFAPVRWFRPGSGWFDDDMLEVLDANGYRMALGSVYPLDAHIASPWFAKKFISSKAAAGSIVVLHDSQGRGERTLATLAEIVPRLEAQGYRFVTLSTLAALERS